MTGARVLTSLAPVSGGRLSGRSSCFCVKSQNTQRRVYYHDTGIAGRLTGAI
jgi:hypothetical protein